ncbi:MAG: type II secretion system protein GspG [Planctomycetes bacterium]|nr:type II secretion system protein GspG [Planctomycetota bacterium]
MFKRQARFITRSARKGLTLIELIVVISIVAVLAVLAAPEVMHWLDQAKVDAAKSDLSVIYNTINRFKLAMGRYPNDLNELSQKLSDGTRHWPGELEADMLNDPWDTPYGYSKDKGPNDGPIVWSFGQNKIEGGEEYDTDLFHPSQQE